MTKRSISKRTREEAIEALLTCADDRLRGEYTTTDDVCDGPAERLADKAWCEVTRTDAVPYHELPLNSARYLEAAALLRGDDEHEPWSPGDPIYLRTEGQYGPAVSP